MAKNYTCDNWLAKLLVCANLMISDKSLHISTLKNVMCDILEAKMYSVIFCQRIKKGYSGVSKFSCEYILPISPYIKCVPTGIDYVIKIGLFKILFPQPPHPSPLFAWFHALMKTEGVCNFSTPLLNAWHTFRPSLKPRSVTHLFLKINLKNGPGFYKNKGF